MKKYWYQNQLRILQTVLRERDLEGYDADSVVEYMKKSHTNTLVVSAGAVVDFFPNKLEMSRQSRFLAERDVLKELVGKCHENGMHVIFRVDFRGVERERYEKNPDWFGLGPEGEPLTGWNDRIFRPCYTGIYGNAHARRIVRNLMEEYDPDGIWENCVVFGYGPCYCRSCREQYKAYSGSEIPVGDYQSEEFRQYREWKSARALEHMDRMRQSVKAYGEEKVYVSEIFGMFHVSSALNSGIDLYDAADRFDFLVTPLFLDGSGQPEKKYEDYSHAASGIRFLKAMSPRKQCVALTGGNGTKWRYVKAPSAESRVWMWEAVSTGGNLWNTYFNGNHPNNTVDRRNAFIEREIYQYLKENEALLNGQTPAGDIGIYYSRPSRDRFGKDSMQEDEYGIGIRGTEKVLLEAHMGMKYIPDLDFSYERLRGLKGLILPNAACMSREHMDIIRRYVEEGGGLVATYRTSLYDEEGRGREDFGLSGLFGVSFSGIEKDTRWDCYQKVRHPEHPVLKGMDIGNTQMIINEGRTLLCRKARQDYETVCTYVPVIYNQPPEFAQIKEEETDYPTITAGTYGKGRVVYFANQTDRSCYDNGHEDLIQTFENAVRWAGRDAFSYTASAPHSVHISMTEDVENPRRRVFSLVNTSGAGLRPVREVLPVYGIRIRIPGTRLKDYRVLRREGSCSVKEEQGDTGTDIVLEISCIKEYTAIYVEVSE